MFDKALVPFDGSTQVDRILPYVARFAGGLHMPLVLASVLAPGPTSTLEQRREEAEHHLQEIVTRLIGAGVEATAVVAVGRPVQEIVRLVEQEGCNLILLPPRGEVAHAWGALGSITEKVMQASPVPILTIPSLEAAPDQSEGAPAQPPGRRVITHDEEEAARAPAMTPRSAAVHHHPPRVERQLAESVRDPGGRRRRYRGQWRVQRPSRLTGLVVKITRRVQRRRPQGAPPAWQPLSSPGRRGTAGAGAHGRRRTGAPEPSGTLMGRACECI
jgi:nucleotide-binding universal stress UspA family protein